MVVRGVINELVTNGALPVLVQTLAQNEVEPRLRIRIAAAICNLSHAKHSLRRSGHCLGCEVTCQWSSFYACNAVGLLVDHVIGEHQALTGAVALMFKSMLVSGSLSKADRLQEVLLNFRESG